jgi:hypothetical protein
VDAAALINAEVNPKIARVLGIPFVRCMSLQKYIDEGSSEKTS